MNIAGICYFNFAGANDFVSLTRGGKEVASGKGLAGLMRPSTAIAVVPLGVKTVAFQVTERSKDAQQISVVGELVVNYVPEMREHFDFSVYRENGQFRNDPTAQIEDQIKIAVRGPIRAAMAEMSLDEIASGGAVKIESLLCAEVAQVDSLLMKRLIENKIAVQSAAIKSALPADRDVAGAFGAKQREALLAEQDAAVADRRKQAAESDRDIRAYEEETELELATERAKRVTKEGENLVLTAKAEADAIAKRLQPFADMKPGDVLAHALMKAADTGISRLSVDPSLLAAVRGASEE